MKYVRIHVYECMINVKYVRIHVYENGGKMAEM